MKVAFEIPDEFDVMSFTIVSTESSGFRTKIKTFTHCFGLEDGKSIRVVEKEKDGYRAVEE